MADPALLNVSTAMRRLIAAIGHWLDARRGDRSHTTAPVPEQRAADAGAEALRLVSEGNRYLDGNDLEAAAECYRGAASRDPQCVSARVNLGYVLRELGRLPEAERELLEVLALDSRSADANYLLGAVRLQGGDAAGAVAALQRATDLQPGLVQAHRDLGKALFDTGQVGRVQAALERGLEVAPDDFDLHFYLGNLHAESQRFDQALASYRHALGVQPDHAPLHSNLVPVLINFCDFAGAVAAARRALELDAGQFNARSNLLMALSRDPACTPQAYLAEARSYGEALTCRVAAAGAVSREVSLPHAVPPCPAGDTARSLRVGLVSGDLRHHPVGHFLEKVLSHWDHGDMAVLAYANQRHDDELTARLRPCFDAWHSVFGMDDRVAAGKIADDRIDLLVDLSGHTSGNRLGVFALRPAPVQATWLGYWASTGVPTIDYLIADAVGVPAAHRADFTETLCYLPETRLCFSAPGEAPAVSELPALQRGCVTFGSFQSLVKLNGDVLRLWARVMSSIPDSRLRLQCLQVQDAAARHELLQRLDRAGIDTGRVAIFPPAGRSQYLAAHAEVDILLDTFPHPGGTTTCEALWMGVPTLTLAGRTLLARQGASLMSAAGLPDWVAADPDEYVAKAVRRASDLPSLAVLRSTLRDTAARSPVFDAGRFARGLQRALRSIAVAADNPAAAATASAPHRSGLPPCPAS